MQPQLLQTHLLFRTCYEVALKEVAEERARLKVEQQAVEICHFEIG
jgi:hypothetical protein